MPVVVLDADHKVKVCLTECRRERDEAEAYCVSEFGKSILFSLHIFLLHMNQVGIAEILTGPCN